MANAAVDGSPPSPRLPSWMVNKHPLPQLLNSNAKRLSEWPSNIISRNPKRFILSGKPRKMFVTGKPRYMFLSLGKPRNFFHRQPFKTPPRKRDKQSKGDSNIQEPRQPSKKRNRLDSVEKHRERSVHQELEAGQALKVRVRLDTVFEKENYSNCSLQKKGTLSKGVTTTSKGPGKRRKLSLGKNSKSLKCYTCGVFVKDAHFEEHLFFGESECTRCNLKIIDCQTFVENRIDCLMGNSLCSHTLRFTKKPSDYISNRLAQELPFEWDTSRRLASYISSLQKLKMIDPWKRAINQCQNFLDGEPSHVSEASEGRINASETATDFSFRQETVPTYEHESSNLPSPSLVNGDGDLVLSQSYNLEHLNEAVEYEVAHDSPLVTREISPSSSESSGGNNITGSLLYPKANIATVSESSVSKNASKGKSSSDISESLSSSNSHKTLKSLKTKSKAEKRSKARNSSKASKDVEKTFLETPSDGYYLVVRRAIEECPMCYTELCPSRFTVNVNTFLLSTVCIGCNLTIYIIFDPPDGSAPKIAIVTEEHSMKHKECKPKKKKTEYEGRTRVKDFFKK
ncbi:uncharacterized protein LOC122267662 [Penaeus japonicus]|uniref:uncharacterized protein LOC122267662 n=1 Tax=Penaeus japonicus TaxID=27405 RepID=UPI001C70E613|nr:uncharacterized protein LOC122267662 [Penaeus japonicus]XP_042893685.1 uncharacterized protein LOC122267662 [Penaeus japonicus]